jgi:hypothetical protein
MKISWKKIRETLNSINGIQIGGISWDVKALDITKAHKLFVFLEDKRVLYSEEDWEFMPQVIQSVANIREYLVNNILMETGSDSLLYESTKELRNACVEFLDMTNKLERSNDGRPDWKESNYRLMRIVLGRIRRRFGKELGKISIHYKVDVEENLARIIPSSPNHDSKLLNEE